MKVRVDQVKPNPMQPRTFFDENEINELAQSIRENDLIQPITVIKNGGGGYVIVDGERRWRAHQVLGRKMIHVTVREGSAKDGIEMLTTALVANIQRADMGYVDEARAYKTLVDAYGVEGAVQKLGVSDATIYGRLGLLDLAPGVQEFYNARRLPFDPKLTAVLRKLSHDDQESLALMAISRGWRAASLTRAAHQMLSKTGKDFTPMKRVREVVEVKGKFDAVAMILVLGGDPSNVPANVLDATRTECKACALYREASPKVCRQCPLPGALTRIKN